MTFRKRLTSKQKVALDQHRAKWLPHACTICTATEIISHFDVDLKCFTGWHCERCGYRWWRPLDDLVGEVT